MHLKKFISAICALSMSASVMAGLAVTVNAESIYTNDYEAAGAEADWKSSVDGRFTPVILEENGNHYMSVNQDQRVNNGCKLTSESLAGNVAAGDDFVLTFDMKIASSNDQTPVEFIVYDAANTDAVFSLTATNKNTIEWIINSNTANTISLSGTMPAVISAIPWYKVFIARKGAATYIEISDASGNAVFEKAMVNSPSLTGGLGKMEFVTKRNNANLAIDNVIVRDIETGDVPEIATASYSIRYVTTGEQVLEKTASGIGAVGEAPSLLPDDTADFLENGQKYIYVSDNSAETAITDDDSAVVTVTVRAAASYSVKVTGGETVLADTSVFEGDEYTYSFPKYITDNKHRVTYTTSDTNYSKTIKATQDTVIEIPYTAYEGMAYFAEHEDLSDANTDKNGNYSNGTVSRAVDDGIAAFTIGQGGTYTITFAGACRNTNNDNVISIYKNSAKEENLLFSEDVKPASVNTIQTMGIKTKSGIALETGDVIIVQGKSNETWIDYIYAEQISAVDGIYYRNNFEAGDSAMDWTSPNAADALSVAVAEGNDHYLSYVGNKVSGNRSASVDLSAFALDRYAVEFDAKVSPGTDQVSQLAIYKNGGLGKNNEGVSADDAIIYLNAAEANGSTWTVNGDSEKPVTLADSFQGDDTWYHFTTAVDGRRVYLTICDAGGNVVLERTGFNTGGMIGGIKFNAGRLYWDVGFDNIVIRDLADGDLPSAPQADFSIKYVAEGGAELTKTSWYFGTVGEAPVLPATDRKSFIEDGQKYLYVSDDSAEKTIDGDGSTVVVVTVRAAKKYAVKVTGGDRVICEAQVDEGDAVTYSYSKYLTDDNKKVVYEIPDTVGKDAFDSIVFTETIYPEENTVTELPYVPYEGTAYFVEHEALSDANAWNHAHASGGILTRAVDAGAEAFTVAAAGTYDITVVEACVKQYQPAPFAVYRNSVSEENLIFSETEEDNVVGVNLQSQGAKTITDVELNAGDVIIIQGESDKTYIDCVLAVMASDGGEPIIEPDESFYFAENGSAVAVLTNDGDKEIEVGLFTAVYGENGELISVKLDKKVVKPQETIGLQAENTDNGKSKAFLWDISANNMPISEAITYTLSEGK